MKVPILVVSFFLFLTGAVAQNSGRVNGSVSKEDKPVEGATISLLRSKDSSTFKLSVSNKGGQYLFEGISEGKYLISVTAVGHQKAYSKIIEVTPQQQSIQIPQIVLIPVSKNLSGVTVTSKRPLIENKIDRTVVNVEASITNIGSSALEVLEKSPGVSVDRDGNISLKGKEGVLVMVDGRPTQLSGADLANLLRSMNSSQLDQIETMTNPPARYDAAGNAGIINIKTKKIVTAGYNGTANIGYTQGRYPKTNESLNFNYREGKVNVFTNLSHNYQKRYVNLEVDRNIYNSDLTAIDNIFLQRNNRITTSHSYSTKLGVDFFATKKTTLGAVVNFNLRPMSVEGITNTNILNASKDLLSLTRAQVNNENEWKSINTNIYLRRVLDAKGKELTADLDFVKYSSANNQFMVNHYANAMGESLNISDTLTGNLPQNLEVYSGRIDYVQPLKKDVKFEAGVKSSVVRTDNNASYYFIQNGNNIHDNDRSNHFIYEEIVNAAYVNLSTPLSKKLSAQFGLRLENTISKGQQITAGKEFSNPYTNLFPTAYFQYKANDDNNFGANLGRRIRRPGYQSLNPFVRLIDRYIYQIGNPDLKPTISNTFEVSHSWKNKIITTLNYTSIKDVISEASEQRGQETYNFPANISSLKQFGISVNANTPITKWWTSNISINVFHNKTRGEVTKASVDQSATAIMLNGTQQFKINKTLSAELNGMYRNGGLEGVIRVKSFGLIGAGLSQQVLKGKGSIKVSARDVFHTQKLKGSSQYGNVDFDIRQVSETQTVSIAFTYSFNKGKKIAPVKRTAGSAGEEQGRIEQ